MNRGEAVTLDGATLVNGLANDVHDTAEGSLSDGDHDGSASVDDLGTTDETLGTVHGNGTDRVLSKVRSDLEDETATVEVLDLERVQDGGERVGIELDVDDGTNDGLDDTGCLGLSSIAAGG